MPAVKWILSLKVSPPRPILYAVNIDRQKPLSVFEKNFPAGIWRFPVRIFFVDGIPFSPPRNVWASLTGGVSFPTKDISFPIRDISFPGKDILRP